MDRGHAAGAARRKLPRSAGLANCHVVTLAIAPTVPPHTHSNARFSHLALLKTTEELLGVRRPLGRSRTAPAMRAAFNL